MHPPQITRARELRNDMTKVEWFVWSRLRGRKVGGYKFRRQVPLGPYFADFACPAAHLVVEIDGEGHDQVQDDRRDAWLRAKGYRVLRISAQEVDESIDDVMDSIYDAVTSSNANQPSAVAAAAMTPPQDTR